MTSFPSLFRARPALTILSAAALAFGLGACRSSPKVTRTAAPAPTAQGWPAAPSPSQRELDDAKALAFSANKSAAEAQQKADAAGLEARSLADQLRAEQDRNADLEDQLADLGGRIESLEQRPAPARAAAASADPLAQVMADLQARSQAEVLREGNLVVMRVTDAFKAGSDSLKNDVQLITSLNAAAATLARYPAASVSVVGHSDGDPINKSGKLWRDNDHLSQARAERVAQVLAHNGVQESRISVEGRGFRDPVVAPETSSADKARNRRVEILIRM